MFLTFQSYREDVTGWSTLLSSPPLFSASAPSPSGRRSFLVRAPVRDGEFGAFRQVALVRTPPTTSRRRGGGSAADAADAADAAADAGGNAIPDLGVDAPGRSRPLPLGHLEVSRLLGWDEAKEAAYFLGVPADSPSRRHVYSAGTGWAPGAAEPRMPECLTCGIDPALLGGRRCTYVDARFNPAMTHYVLECLGPDLPGTFLVSVEPEFVNLTEAATTTAAAAAPSSSSSSVAVVVSDSDGDGGGGAAGSAAAQVSVRVLDPQDALREAMAPMARPRIETMDIPAEADDEAEEDGGGGGGGGGERGDAKGEEDKEAGDGGEGGETEKGDLTSGRAVGEGRTLRAKLYLPPYLRKSDHIKYPLVVHV